MALLIICHSGSNVFYQNINYTFIRSFVDNNKHSYLRVHIFAITLDRHKISLCLLYLPQYLNSTLCSKPQLEMSPYPHLVQLPQPELSIAHTPSPPVTSIHIQQQQIAV